MCPCNLNHIAFVDSLPALQTKLKSINTNPLIIKAITSLLLAQHKRTKPNCPKPPFFKRKQLEVLRAVFQQQQRLGPTYLLRGILARNWSVLQNLHTNAPPDHIDLPWLSQLIKTLWDHAHTRWVARCNQVNHSTADNPQSLTHAEQLAVIRQHLKRPRTTLTTEEKQLHWNISRGMKTAHTTTLAHWIDLLREVQADSIRKKSSARPPGGVVTRITKYFKVKKTKQNQEKCQY